MIRKLQFFFIFLLVRSICFSSLKNEDLELWNQFKKISHTEGVNSVFAYFGNQNGYYNKALRPCQEIAEAPDDGKEFLEDQLTKIANKYLGIEYHLRPKKLKVHNFCEPFKLHFLYDWIVLKGLSYEYENSDIFWDNVVRHALNGVIVLNSLNPDQVNVKLHERGFIPNKENQIKLSKYIYNSNFKNLKLFKNNNPKTFLLSYTRSGSTWLTRSISTMHQNQLASYIDEFQRHSRDYQIDLLSSPPHHFIKVHNPLVVKSQSKGSENNNLIVIVRNYFECMISSTGNFECALRDLLKTKIPDHFNVHDYFNILKMYDSWDPNHRILIYYEDLITNFYSEMKRVVDFLQTPLKNLENFMNNYEKHRLTQLQSYDKQHQLKSDGKDLLFHSRDIPLSKLKAMEFYIKNRYPFLWEKYLSRYAIKNP